MDHGHGHDDMDMGGGQCSMNMLFTWSTKDLCIVFKQWRITGTASLLFSLLAIVLLCAGYEFVRAFSTRYEASHNAKMSTYSTGASSEGSSLLGTGRDTKEAAESKGKLIRGLLYAVQVFYSFFIMLLFMTYNGWIMLAVAVGAFAGYMLFTSQLSATKSVACH